MKISEVRNARVFQELCQSLLCAEYEDTQIVRDSNGDGGMDAYVPSTKTLYAMYCPRTVPPPKKYYQGKIRGDLKKAVTLRDDKGYAINRWIFLTPEPMEEELHRYLGDKVNKAGFSSGANQSESHLNNLFLKHPHFRSQFPELLIPDIEAQLTEIRDEIRGRDGVTRSANDEFAYCTAQALRIIHNKLSGLDLSLPRTEVSLIEEQWQLGKPVLLSGEPGTGKSGIAAMLATPENKPVLLLDARMVAHIADEPSLRRMFHSTNPLSQTIANQAQSTGFRLIMGLWESLWDAPRYSGQ